MNQIYYQVSKRFQKVNQSKLNTGQTHNLNWGNIKMESVTIELSLTWEKAYNYRNGVM